MLIVASVSRFFSLDTDALINSKSSGSCLMSMGPLEEYNWQLVLALCMVLPTLVIHCHRVCQSLGCSRLIQRGVREL